MNDHRRRDPLPGTSPSYTRAQLASSTHAQHQEISQSQPLATSTPRNSPQREDPEDHRPKDESCRDSKAPKSYPHNSPCKKSLRLEEEMKQELRLWNHSSSSRSTTQPPLDRTATKRRQWKLPTEEEQQQTMAISTMLIPRSVTTSIQPRTIPLREDHSMTTRSSSRYTSQLQANNTRPPERSTTHPSNSNNRMPTWITMAASNSNTDRNTRCSLITSTSQSPSTSTSRIREGSNEQLQQNLWHNSLSRAIRTPPQYHNRPSEQLRRPQSPGDQHDLHQELRLQNHPESFLSLELQPLPPPPPCRTENNEQLHLSMSSPSLFEESFSPTSPDTALNLTAQPRQRPF